MKVILLSIAVFVLAAVAAYYVYKSKNTVVKNTSEITQQYQSQFKDDDFSLQGKYRWTFFLGPAEQLSEHTFASDKIHYRMEGRVFSTDYTMHKLSYDAEMKKWIGQDNDGIVFVMFFKDITDEQITIYKHKCKEGGLKEALDFPYPPADATADHGWNVYTLEGVAEKSDELPFEDEFSYEDKTIAMADAQTVWKNKTYTKLTHHLGERRWVGQLDDEYLVVFYEYEEGNKDIRLSITETKDVEKAYKIKHNEVAYAVFTTK